MIGAALLKSAAPWALAATMSGGWYLKHNYAEREIGRRDLLIAQEQARGDSLAERLKHLAPQIARIDTIVKRDVRVVTAQVEHLRIDTMVLRDTVRVAGELRVAIPLRVVDSVRSALSSCSSLAVDCTEQRARLGEQVELLAADTLAKARTISLVRGAVPSGFRTWTERGFAAGVGLFAGWLAWHARK